jgi:integrase/recombinase XerC
LRLSTAIRRFDTQIRADGKCCHTRGAYLRDLRRLEDWLGNAIDASHITPDMLARYLAQCSSSTPAITLNRTKTAIRAFFKFLVDADLIETNPARFIRNHRADPKPPEHLTAAEVRALLSALRRTRRPAARRDHVLFSLVLGTGLRIGSVVGLRVGDIDEKGRYVITAAKGGIECRVYFNSGLSRRLNAYITAFGLHTDDPLFPSRNGGHLSPRQVQLRFKRWLEAAGIDSKYSFHSLRHTFAMNLYRKTGDLRLVQTALGHKRITTTEIYARVDNRRLKRALEKL